MMNKFRCVLSCLLTALALAEARAEGPVTVCVRFKVDIGRIRKDLGPEAEKQIAEKLADVCSHENQLPWVFKHGEVFPAIEIRLLEDNKATSWRFTVDVYNQQGKKCTRDGDLQHIVLEPGDLGVVEPPASNALPDAMAGWFRRFLIEKEGTERLRSHLQKYVPIATGKVLTKDAPASVDEAVGVVWLDFDHFQHLSGSYFTCLCPRRDPATGAVVLESHGEKHSFKSGNRCGIQIRHVKMDESAISPELLRRFAELQDDATVLLLEFRPRLEDLIGASDYEIPVADAR